MIIFALIFEKKIGGGENRNKPLDITFLVEFFNGTIGSLLLIFRIFRVDTKSFEAKGPPLEFFGANRIYRNPETAN